MLFRAGLGVTWGVERNVADKQKVIGFVGAVSVFSIGLDSATSGLSGPFAAAQHRGMVLFLSCSLLLEYTRQTEISWISKINNLLIGVES